MIRNTEPRRTPRQRALLGVRTALILCCALPACAAGSHDGGSATGSLALAVENLPSDAVPEISVSGVAGYQAGFHESQVVTGLAPGSYTVTAPDVASGGVTYAAINPVQTVTVTGGGSTAADVTYRPSSAGYPALAAGFLPRTMMVDGVSRAYQVYIPPGYDPAVAHRVILFCHGSDQNFNGSNAGAQTTVGLGHYITANGNTFPDVVVFPQLPTGLGDSASAAAMAYRILHTALDLTEAEVNTDLSRVAVTGVSSGGSFAWMMAYQEPTRYAAAAPIAAFILGPRITQVAGVSNSTAEQLAAARLAGMPIHTYVGSLDNAALISSAAADAAAFSGHPNFLYTVVPGADHGGSWDTTYASAAFWTWLRAQHR